MIASVKLKTGGFIITDTDGTVSEIGDDPTNIDFQKVQDWIAAGNLPDPADPAPQPLTVRQQIVARLREDPILKAQVINSFEARGITDKQLMLDALEAKFGDPI